MLGLDCPCRKQIFRTITEVPEFKLSLWETSISSSKHSNSAILSFQYLFAIELEPFVVVELRFEE